MSTKTLLENDAKNSVIAMSEWASVLSILVLLAVAGVAQGQTVPGGSASKPGGAPGGGGRSDDSQECAFYGIPPEFEIRPGEGRYSELWYHGRYYAYDYDPATKMAYPPYGNQSSPYFGPFGPVHVADLSSMNERALDYYHSRSSKWRGPLSEAERKYVESLNKRRAWIAVGVNGAAALQTIAAARAGIPRQPVAVVTVPAYSTTTQGAILAFRPTSPPIRMSGNRQAGSLFPKGRKNHMQHKMKILEQLIADPGSKFPSTNPPFVRLRQADATVVSSPGIEGHIAFVRWDVQPNNSRVPQWSRALASEIAQAHPRMSSVKFLSILTPKQVVAMDRVEGIRARPATTNERLFDLKSKEVKAPFTVWTWIEPTN